MTKKNYLLKLSITFLLMFFIFDALGQEPKIFKHFDDSTIDKVNIDFDKDGDLDFIYAGVITDRNQGRVYLVENKGSKFKKPQYIFSFPTIAVKQNIIIDIKDNIIKIIMIGVSPKNVKTRYVATIDNGEFQGLLIPPVTSGSLEKN